jgi:diaminohydroxyphosphoribosylaminopyrimidine deaminase / 5-amino-6-(5-phosphoribosylamino)uracil reductase
VSDRTTDRRYMRRALALALRGRGTTAPNPMVGAVVVRDGRIVGEGFTQPPGQPHAEAMALRAAGAQGRGATIYATLEPCSSTGRTPPCADAIIAAGVTRVVYAATDPNPKMAGGAEKLRAAGIEVVGGVEAQAALDQNPAFFHQFVSDRPWVTLKLARTLDGGIADGRRGPAPITGPASRREVHRQRADHDAVAVGRGTLLADDPLLTVREGAATGRAPARVVFARRGEVPSASRLVQSARDGGAVIVAAESVTASGRAALETAGVSIVTGVGLTAQLQALRAAGLTSLYVEGGAVLADALLAEGLVDRLVIFTAPVRLGADAVRPLQAGTPVLVEHATRARLVAHRRLGDDLMAIYDLRDSVHRTR